MASKYKGKVIAVNVEEQYDVFDDENGYYLEQDYFVDRWFENKKYNSLI